jgi:hypothetical protein
MPRIVIVILIYYRNRHMDLKCVVYFIGYLMNLLIPQNWFPVAGCDV